MEPDLLGRDDELLALKRVIDTGRAGVSSTVAVLGDPGAGKSALLARALADVGDDQSVLRATGVETERHLPFAGLLQLLRPALPLLDALPEPQANALTAALGLTPATPDHADRFMIGAGVLSLLSHYAEEAPLVVVVDDLHALDFPSAEALLFTARRLAADPIAMIFAGRTPDADHLVAGLPTLRLGGLGADAAAALAARAVRGPLPASRLEPLLARAQGNPLALLELASDDLDRLATDPEDLPRRVPDAVTEAFGRRIDQLDADARGVLLAAAVCGGDLPLTLATCTALGVDPAALPDLEDAGLVRLAPGRVELRHPLVAAAAYTRATTADRRAAHAAAADALPADDVDRRAWHLAEAVWLPDPEVAALLHEAGERARQRTAYSVASGAFERSARLSDDADLRAMRLLRAAEAAWSAGLSERAQALLDTLEREEAPDAPRVEVLALRGAIAARVGRLEEARQMLVAAADLSSDPAEQCVLIADAVHASFYLAGAPAAVEMAGRLQSLAPQVTDPRASALALIATGMAQIMAGKGGGADELRRAVPLILATPELYDDPYRLSCVMLVPLFLRDTTEASTLRDLVDDMRHRAGVGALPAVLWHVARDQATASAWPEAAANYTESARLAEETGQVTEQLMSLAGLCWLQSRMGLADECRLAGQQAMEASVQQFMPMAQAWVRYALGDLELSLGEPSRAVEQFQLLLELLAVHELQDVDLVPGPELADALVRLGDRQGAIAVADDYQRKATAKGQAWALARAARARGTTTTSDEASPCFEQALALHEETPDRFETARTELAYGEWLRRSAQRVAARPHLRHALDIFDELGATLWGERAARELAATGETVQRRGADPRSLLTPQELQVCLQLIEGRTTREAAAALFLSPKTVEYHLRKVYTKLDISSRAELSEILG